MATADSDVLRANYDEAPYEQLAHPQSAPGLLAAVAWLFGLESPDVGTARVLELGCASAGNLIPFAATHPRARCVGIDLSPAQIAQGTSRTRDLGLTNVELVVADLAALDVEHLGTFDFIVAHGVYSWVPDDVQEAVLRIIARTLAPTGVAYVSYNVYPGWKTKEIVRDAMLLGARDSRTAQEKVRAARDAVDFLQRVTDPTSVVGQALATYQGTGATGGDFYLLHEELEEFNSPCYFQDFAARSAAHGLTYVADTELKFSFVQNYGAAVGERLLRMYGNDRLRVEQHLDFILSRVFRQSLLVHDDRTPVAPEELDLGRIRRLHLAAWAPSLTGELVLDASPQQLGQRALFFTTDDPATKAAVAVLNDRWPWTLPHDRLLVLTRDRLRAAGFAVPPDLAERIDALLHVLIVQGHAQFRLDAVTPLAGGTPILLDEVVRRYAEATRDDDQALVVNPWHELVPLAPLDRVLVPLLDGHHDRDALIDVLTNLFLDNGFRLDTDDGEVVDEATARALLAAEVDTLPERLADAKLLDLNG